jgi:chorismate mutase
VGMRCVRGVRGAISVEADDAEAIGAATKRLLQAMVARNGIELEDIASVFFSLTPDLRAIFPAVAAREMGWMYVPMLHTVELDVPGALQRCIRVLMHVNTSLPLEEVTHVYLDGAVVLRPDLIPVAPA